MSVIQAGAQALPQSCVDLLNWMRDEYRDLTAVVDGEERISFAELVRRIEGVSKALIAAGARRGDRIAVWMPNCWQWPVVALGLQTLGIQLVPLNTRYQGREAQYILEKTRAKMLFVYSGFLDIDPVAKLAEAAGQAAGDRPFADLPYLKRIVDVAPSAAEALSFSRFIESGRQTSDDALDLARLQVEPDDIADILFTSGTTGSPKGVLVTQRQSLACIDGWADAIQATPGDRYLIVNPFFHVFGYRYGWLLCLYRGVTNYPVAVLDPRSVCELIEREKITILPGPPTLYQTLLTFGGLADYDLSSLRSAVTGSADVPIELVSKIRSELGFDIIAVSYGLTEFTGAATMTGIKDEPEIVSRTAGHVLPGVEMMIEIRDGSSSTEPATGEVLLRGELVMLGYLDDPEATAKAFGEGGWLRTGDIGWIDEDGNLTITGRIKDMILVGGFNVYPAEIESVLCEHPSVVHAAVKSLADERLGAVPQAWVVPTSPEACTEVELIAWCKQRLANFKTPRRVQFLAQMPMTPSGKVQKFQLLD
jgi:acyl-CoA synthetase (AMP-forming)/AMP-acid ligase II